MDSFVLDFSSQKEYRALCECLRGAAARPILVGGLCEGAQNAFLAAVASEWQSETGGALLLLAPDEKKARRTLDALTAMGLRALPYLYRDPILHNITGSHDFEHERLKTLSALLSGQFDAVVATPDAALQGTIPPDFLRAASLTVRKDSPLTQEDLVRHLTAAGYHRVDLVDSPGQYALRGGIVDCYSPAESAPLRADFFGDELDRAGVFDVMTQRTTDAVDTYTLSPCRELLFDEESRERVRRAIERLLRAQKAADPAVREELEGELAALADEGELSCADKYLPLLYPEGACLLDYLPGCLPVALEYDAVLARQKEQDAHTALTMGELLERGEIPARCAESARTAADLEELLLSRKSLLVCNFGAALPERRLAGAFSFRTRPTPAYSSAGGGSLDLFFEDLLDFLSRGYRVCVLSGSEKERENLRRVLEDRDARFTGSRVTLTVSQICAGFELPDSRFALLSLVRQSTLRSNYKRKRRAKREDAARVFSVEDLVPGDYVVHEDHGIGRYLGIAPLVVDGARRDFLQISYAGGDKLYLPCDSLEKISKYIGAGAENGTVKLSKIGGAEWTRAKSRARASARGMAKELIELYAARLRAPGYAYPADDEMMREFEEAFPYTETEGQLAAIEDVKADMMASHPMDRILCGDVGYGKTEVALRAAFKAAECGKQTAILVPTTILAMQHYRTMLERMHGFPVQVDMLCRLRTEREQELTLRRLARGEVDIVVGTHRLLSDDVKFKNLGLLVVDEEQRFGVSHKEKLKRLSTGIDVLTLSATPIPRTMNMALSGIRDMSLLEEAPDDRLPVQSFVIEYEEEVIAEAVRRELRRGGQVFYLCNRIEKLRSAAASLAKMAPGARIETANGRMDKELLSDIWQAMVDGEIDILVTTTIIETGVDVPNANTLIVERADKLGLSQLHQIRGRVGRSSRRAYAYFTYPRGMALTEVSEKRLSAIRDFTEFGAGFRIAMRDMEIRGAGNLLGADQSGHMEAIGYDLYMKILREAVLEEKGESAPPRAECTVELGIGAFLPESYIENASARIDTYRKISLIEGRADALDVYDELFDRYGDPPREACNVLEASLLRALGERCGMRRIERKGGAMVLTPHPDRADPRRLAELASRGKGRVMLSLAAGSPTLTLRSATPQDLPDDTIRLLTAYEKMAQ